MEKKLSSNLHTPRPPFIFLLIALVSVLQIPANLLMKSFSFNLGIIVNEVLIIAGLPLAAVFYLGFDRSRLLTFTTPKIKVWTLAALLSIPAALIIDYATAASESVLPLPQKYHAILNQLMTYNGNREFFLKLFILCFLPGICEEIFFRGICQTSLEIRWGTKKAVILTALFFALLHGNPWYFHLYFLLGFFLSWVYAVSRTLWIPILCHIINNAWTFINHAIQVKYPIRGFHNPLDILIIAAGIILVLILGISFKKSQTVT